MEITTFSLTRLGIASRIQFIENVINVIDLNDATALRVENQYSKLRNSWRALSDLYITDAKNPLSQEIFNLDLQRDECLWSIWLLVEGHSHSPIAPKRQAAEKLLRNLTLYADSPIAFARQKYDVQTNNITNLISGWNTVAELMAARDILDLSELTTRLSEINSQHNIKFLERNAMYAAQPTETSSHRQVETTTAYYDLFRALNSMAYVTPSPLYDKTIREINSLIETTEISLRQSLGHKKATSTQSI